MSRLRRPFLSDRYFFITAGLLKGRTLLQDADFQLMAVALNRTRHQHPNPVKAGLVHRPEDRPWSSVREYSGSLQDSATRHPILPIDRVLLPSDQRTRI